MTAHSIRVRGARTHNLRDVDVDLPWEAWTAVCGVSGSGKSSLVLDTLGAESQRRFLGSLGRTAEGSELFARPDVDRIEGLPPAVVVGAGERAPGPLETVGTVTELSHALRALWARAATPHCPGCGAALEVLAREAIVERVRALPAGSRVLVLARGGRGPQALEAAVRAGWVRVRVDGGAAVRVDELAPATLAPGAVVDVVLDRVVVQPGAEALRERLRDTVEQALALGGGVLRLRVEPASGAGQEQVLAARPVCGTCEQAWPLLAPRLFAPTHPQGACPACAGRGEQALAPAPGRNARAGRRSSGRSARAARRPLARAARAHAPLAGDEAAACPACHGTRLAPFGAAARLGGLTLPALEALPLAAASAWLAALAPQAGARPAGVPAGPGTARTGTALHATALHATALQATALPRTALPPLAEACERSAALCALGLGHLPAARAAQRLSRGELRRARLAGALSLGMGGLLYLLDEPMASCHVAERGALRARLRSLVEGGSTVVSVEHDLEAVRAADHVIELGPGPGAEGGRCVALGTPAAVARGATALGRALARAPLPARSQPRGTPRWIELEGLALRNLAGLALRLPSPGLTCVSGVSGAGKSTLVLGCLQRLAQAALELVPAPPAAFGRARGLEAFRHVSAAEARAARHPRATVVSLLGAFAPLRELYAQVLEARTRGWGEGRFSLARPGGRCEACRGTGWLAATLAGAPGARGPCEACGGRRYGAEVEAVRVKGLSIADLLERTLGEAAPMFRDLPRVGPALAAAAEVGLGWLPLGRAASELSTGEVLRLRLAAALGRGGSGPTLYLLDEPSAGLHPDDVEHLARVLDRLVEAGHTVVAVEHDLSLLRRADHVLDLGPGPGEAGGRLLYAGPPQGLVGAPTPTGQALAAQPGAMPGGTPGAPPAARSRASGRRGTPRR